MCWLILYPNSIFNNPAKSNFDTTSLMSNVISPIKFPLLSSLGITVFAFKIKEG